MRRRCLRRGEISEGIAFQPSRLSKRRASSMVRSASREATPLKPRAAGEPASPAEPPRPCFCVTREHEQRHTLSGRTELSCLAPPACSPAQHKL